MLQTVTLKLVTVHFKNTELFREGCEISLNPCEHVGCVDLAL